MKDVLFITCESGRVVSFNTNTFSIEVLYEDPGRECLFGITCHETRVFFTGATILAAANVDSNRFELIRTVVPFPNIMRGEFCRFMRWFWSSLGRHSRAIRYDKPCLHQMNVYRDRIYIAATVWNEIWVVDFGLNVLQRIPLAPYLRDFYHLNNVFCDGTAFHVCLNRYDGRPGHGGYVTFDLDWSELGRTRLGSESHALSMIDGKIMQLSCSSPPPIVVQRPTRRGGLMLDDRIVFEYDANRFYCKDFSMNHDHIYIVGGGLADRANRASAPGVVLVLGRDYRLIRECVFPGLGGFNGCRLPGIDFSKGLSPGSSMPSGNDTGHA